MRRVFLAASATVSVCLVIGLQPVAATAAGIQLVPAAPSATFEPTTAPFDPICPLCFVREFLESLS